MSTDSTPDDAERYLHPAPLHDAMDLTGGGRCALIRLEDQVYTLRVTRAGKLILTK